MLSIKLRVGNGGMLEVNEYEISYPYSSQINNKSFEKLECNVASIKCQKIQGSFTLYYSRKIDISNIADSSKIDGGSLDSVKNVVISDDATAKQYLMLQRRFFLYVNEQDSSSYMNEKTVPLPAFLIRSVDDIKQSVKFWLEYENNKFVLKDEEINLQLNIKKQV